MRLRQRHPDGTSVKTVCELFGKTRGAYYKKTDEQVTAWRLKEKEILEQVRQIRSEAPGIGCYKLFLMLKKLYGKRMTGRDRFYALLRRNHLMLKPERTRHTTNSNHQFRKYTNLAKDMVVNAPNRLWVADITYIALAAGVCYLHLLTDAFTHEVVGWTLSDSLKAEATLRAFDMAVEATGGPEAVKALTHHSDRGVQYCCTLYTDRLKSLGVRISMTEDYKPTDNAVAERMNGIIKQEWLYRQPLPRDIDEARATISRVIRFYNHRRPHRSNGFKTPAKMRASHNADEGL